MALTARQVRFTKALKVIGLKKLFKQLPKDVRKVFIENYRLKTIAFDYDQTDISSCTMYEYCKELLNKEAFSLIKRESITLSLLVTDINSIHGLIRSLDFKDLKEKHNKILATLEETIGEIMEENLTKYLTKFVRKLENIQTNVNGSFYNTFYHYQFKTRDLLNISIIKKPPISKIVDIDGKRRSVFRLIDNTRIAGLSIEGTYDIIEWDGQDLKGVPGTDPNKTYPVYLQKHVFERLKERLNCRKSFNGLLNYCIYHSLDEPTFVVNGSNILVPITLGDTGYKVGYLGCIIQEDIVIIKTFFFITMDGTPEGNRLKERFGLTRVDKEYLKIDSIQAFYNSDIDKHPDIKQMFEDCGCGHLIALNSDLDLAFSEDGLFKKKNKYDADFLKNYISVK